VNYLCLLNDKTLVEKQTSGAALVQDLAVPPDWYASGSPIQGSSVDLHVGNILLPGKAGQDEGSADKPLQLYAIESGQTAIVSTLERLCLPNDIAAIGFPPSHVSVKGILMTNPGHVDPGYEGPLRFTVINMGKERYVLKAKDAIVTVLFLKLVQPCERGWVTRRDGKKGGPPTQNDINQLSPDFLDVQARAEKLVKEKIEDANIKLKRSEVKMAVIGTVVSAVLTAIVLSFLAWLSGLQDLKEKVATLQASQSVTNVQSQVDQLKRELNELKAAAAPPSQSNTKPKDTTTK
jgi:deoxycytidine triphosphate deaminase